MQNFVSQVAKRAFDLFIYSFIYLFIYLFTSAKELWGD
jgi:hypothetical protein